MIHSASPQSDLESGTDGQTLNMHENSDHNRQGLRAGLVDQLKAFQKENINNWILTSYRPHAIEYQID